MSDKKASCVDVLATWWPQGRRARFIARADAFTGGRAGRPEALERLIAIAADDTQGPLVQANAAGYLANYADARALNALVAAAKVDHPAIRSAAISGLGVIAVDSGARRSTLLAALGDPRRAVRMAALMGLINQGGGPPDGEDARRFHLVSLELAARARLHEDDAATQRDLGVARLLAGDFDPAAEALQIARGLEPDRSSITFLLGMVRLGQRRLDEAWTLLRQVPASDSTCRGAGAAETDPAMSTFRRI
jgi:tetratricopeptide (TPR) repeat protein